MILDLQFVRYVCREGTSTEETLPIDRFNKFYDFIDVSIRRHDALMYTSDPNRLVMAVGLENLLACFRFFTIRNLQSLSASHGIRLLNTRKDEIIREMSLHECRPACHEILYIFKCRTRERRNVAMHYGQVIRDIIPVPSEIRDSMPGIGQEGVYDSEGETQELEGQSEGPRHEDFDHLKPVDHILKMSLIKDWEQGLKMDNIRVVVCAACSSRELTSSTEAVHGSTIDLKLLRNDELPIHLRPSTYDFLLYERAILDPEGLQNLNSIGLMTICRKCLTSLRKKIMPKFGLCNWLYFAKDKLPDDVARAFRESTMFERMLIGRARCNTICCRFDMSGTGNSGGENANILARSRKGIKGNIMVAPLDTVRMNKVLPPSADTMKDTMCAVFVGDKLPSRATISKLGPILVRKTRVEQMIKFLLSRNPHYETDEDFQFSAHNLNQLFVEGQDVGLPASIHIGNLPCNDAVELGTSDYTPRNEHNEVDQGEESELLMENVGFTEGDDSALAYQTMKILALERCLGGKPFLASGTGSRLVPDFNNPSILTWLFPHLDPWGIGGFYHPRRLNKISMDEQIAHMLRMNDRSFEEDPEFAFVFYNVVRKADICRHVRFRVPARMQTRIIRDLATIEPDELLRLYTIYEKEPLFRPTEPEQRRIVNILRDVTMITRSLPGSNGYKVAMRNQIRAIINARGAPTLFITLNPSDVDHPLVRIFAGDETLDLEDIYRGEDLDSWRRKLLAAKNPSACALFFDFMIRSFIAKILRYGGQQPGLYGVCDAYYGTVEAQGKGTLHLHLLVWLRGHLPPQRLHELLVASEEYKERLTRWLESIIMNEFPMVTDARESEPDRSTRIRSRELGLPHPGTVNGPPSTLADRISEEEFWISYQEHVIQLLHEYNWHEHTATCWKNLKHGQEKKGDNCRMRMDGILIPETTIDPVTGAVNVRRLHPAIASYTDLVTFLMKCNNNIQFIGSGDAAKAYMYYVTDYVTKPTLPMHVGLAALSYAIKKTNERRTDDMNEDSAEFCTRALTTVVNSMMGRQEISQQQVMSYLIGGGDYYTSEKFQVLNFGIFLKYILFRLANFEATLELPRAANEEELTGTDEQVYLAIDEGEVCVSSQIFDYAFRPLEEPYHSMCLYEFTASTVKGKIKGNLALNEDGHGCFSSWDHPQRASQRLYLRKERVLPVILGPTIANPSRSAESKELWSRDVLILFKPWREPEDIKDGETLWTEAYDEFSTSGNFYHEDIVRHMTVLTEGSEARFTIPRPSGNFPLNNAEEIIDNEGSNNEDFPDFNENDLGIWRERHNNDIFRTFDNVLMDGQGQDTRMDLIPNALRSVLGGDVTEILKSCFSLPSINFELERRDNSVRYSVNNFQQVSEYNSMMTLKRKRRISTEEDDDESQGAGRRRVRRRVAPFTSVHSLRAEQEMLNQDRIVRDIIKEKNLASNPEQLKAFMTVANHALGKNTKQLLMYVSGVGGTGKSHIIKSIVKLFEQLDIKASLLLGAPTGIAAVLIEGNTLHSLILECPSNKQRKSKNTTNMTLLTSIWKYVNYLIVDEVSMVGATFLSKLSNAIRKAKGDDIIKSQKPFGGVNVIFMGDFCQLSPPLQKSLYSSSIIKNPSFEESKNATGISAMNGVYLWRQVDTFVELVKNWRHDDDEYYSRFLSRVRVGECISGSSRDGMDDYEYLQSRLLSRIRRENPHELEKFTDAPIIVGTKELRDILNAQLIEYHAARSGAEVHTYYSHDSVKCEPIPSGVQEYLWSLNSKENRDSFGRLPIFEGMKVMITENIAFNNNVVNGSEGVVRQVLYHEDDEGRRYATVAYVYIKGSGFDVPGLGVDVVPIFPTTGRLDNNHLHAIGLQSGSFNRVQLPFVPAYAYTDFKSQGRTLEIATVDLETARRQGVYVMLSRVKKLSGLAILRWFPSARIYFRLSQELREELARLAQLA